MKMGIIDFIEKPFGEQVMWDSISKAVEKSKILLEELRSTKDLSKKLELLTDRENEVLKYLTKGLNDKQIANELNFSQRTAAFHRNNILTKTGLDNIVQLTKTLLQHNLVA